MLAWLSVWNEVQTCIWLSLPLTVTCFSKIQIGFAFLLPALLLTRIVLDTGRWGVRCPEGATVLHHLASSQPRLVGARVPSV